MTILTATNEVQRTVLANGLTVLIRRDTSAPVVAIVTQVKAGYFDETDDVSGIAHVLEHMFFKGTERRGVGEIAKETKASGGYLNAHTIYDNTTYFTVLPASGFAAGLDIQADAFANSVIDAAELAKELEVIVQEAKRKTDNPSSVAVETLYELLHDVHRMRRWRIGHEAGLRSLTREAMQKFYRNFYQPSNTILTVVGDVDMDDAMSRIVRAYGSLPDSAPVLSPGSSEPHHDEFRYRELSGDIEQTQLVFGWRTAPALHEDTPVLDLAASLLSAGRASRLYRALRERRIVSSVTAYNYTPTELGVFVIHAELNADCAGDAGRGIWDQLRALRDDAIDPLEMERVKRIFESRWIRRQESMEGQATHLSEWEALGGWRLGEEYFERFISTTSEQVHDAVRRYLTPERAGMVIYRPAGSPEVAASPADMLTTLGSQRPKPLEALPPRDQHAIPRASAEPQLEITESGVAVYRTSRGLPILVRKRAGAAIVHLGIHAMGGVRDEPVALAGITNLVASTMIKGTTTRSAAQIAEDSEMLGGSISASVGSESFGWSISVPVQHLEAAAELLADVVLNATLPPEALEIERAVALAEVAALRDDMFGYPMRLVMAGAYRDHPYSRSRLGTEESLRAVEIADSREWYARLLGSPLVAGIVGDVVAGDAAGIVAREFARVSPGAGAPIVQPSWPVEMVVSAESRDKAQTALALAFPGPARNDERRFAARITATIASGLGGRFFDELRDRQSLAYTVHAYIAEHQASGMFLAYIATSPEKEGAAREGLLGEFAKLRETPVTAEELERARKYSIGSHAIRQESGGAVLADMLDAWIFGSGLRELAQHDERIMAVTDADILSLAREFFDPQRRVEGIVRGKSAP